MSVSRTVLDTGVLGDFGFRRTQRRKLSVKLEKRMRQIEAEVVRRRPATKQKDNSAQSEPRRLRNRDFERG